MGYDNTGSPYDIMRTVKDGKFDQDAYRDYSPVFLPISFVLTYGVSFAALSSVLVHTWSESFHHTFGGTTLNGQ